VTDRIAIIAYFRAPHGGLHDHVADQVRFARSLGLDVTLACPPGPLAESMRDRADVVTATFDDPASVADDLQALGTPALIHAHPGLAREAAFSLKALTSAPVLVTYHGSRPETLTAADPRVDIAVTVSDVTRRFILQRTDVDPARIVVIPNAVDTEVFRPTQAATPQPDVVVLASRWDDDKGFVVDIALEALRGIATEEDLAQVDVVVAGDGQRVGELESLCAEVNERRGRPSFSTLGWLSPPDLAAQMAAASVVISPGRGAVQALAVGRATIALGSKGYVGFLEGDALLRGLDTNLGSGGLNPRNYPQGLVVADVRRALARARDVRLLAAYRAVVAKRSLSIVQAAHARLWALALSGLTVSKRAGNRDVLTP
jgi:glycosyltransferase involved in cell wall biosynthesis